MPGQELIAIRFDVFKKQIAKHDRVYSPVKGGRNRLDQISLVLLIAGAFSDLDLMKRRAQTCSLLFKQNAANAVHADAIIIARNGRQQGGDAIIPRLLNLEERQTAIFAATPGHQYRFHVPTLLRRSFVVSSIYSTRQAGAEESAADWLRSPALTVYD